jgi:hypothetical protein
MKQEEIILFENIEFYKLKDYPNYALAKTGELLSLRYLNSNKLKILKPLKSSKYMEYAIGKSYHKTIHRLLAETFIPNPDNKPCVNHIDGNKLNNTVDNLEWCTYSENHLHAYKNNLMKAPWKNKKGKDFPLSKKVDQYDKKGNFIRTWDSIADVERELKLESSSISLCCRNISYKSVGNYVWKYNSPQDL